MKKISGLGIPLFVILPWAGFLISMFNVKSKASAFVYIGFAMLFGIGIAFLDASADSYRYAQAFTRFDSTLDYKTIVTLYRSGEIRDVYRLLLFYFTSIFSNNPKVMYAFAGLVYGIFSYLCLRLFVKERGDNFDKYGFLLALVFFTCISLANINGFRFWTGALVLFYATYNCIILRRKRWILGILVTPLFHYGFILIVPIIILYSFFGRVLYNGIKINSVLYYVFLMSFITSWVLDTNAINLGFLSQVDVISGEVGDRLNYLNRDEVGLAMESRREASIFLNVQTYFNYAIKFYIFIVVLFLHKLLKRITGDKIEYMRLFAFVLFFYCVAFIASSFPVGGRFLIIAHMFLFVLFAKIYVIDKGKKIRRLISWSLPVFSFNILFINLMLPILILTSTFWYGNLFWIIIEGLDFYMY